MDLTGSLSRQTLKVALLGVSGTLLAYAQSTANWPVYTDTQYQVTFRYPPDWKTSPLYSDRIYFGGSDGSVQVVAAGGNDPLKVCRQSATHRMLPYGSRAQIRAMRVDGQRACLVWPSPDQDSTMENCAELAVQLPQPIEIGGYCYGVMTMNAHKKYARQIIASIRFLRGSAGPQKDVRSARQ